MTRVLRNLLLASLSSIAAGCGQSGPAVTVDDVWANATPAGATVAAVYLQITAKSNDTLLAASTTVADHIEMHSSSEQNGMMQMRQLQSVPLEAGKTFTFAPGGTHFMLMGLRQPLVAGLRFPLTLQFEKSPEQLVQVQVVELGSR
jgi:periplasmic copper chaperone A